MAWPWSMAAFDSRCAALYLFLITVADAQGLSYYGDGTLAARLHFSPEELALARARLIELDLLAYQPPLYQVLAIAGTSACALPSPRSIQPVRTRTGPVSLAQLLELERRHA